MQDADRARRPLRTTLVSGGLLLLGLAAVLTLLGPRKTSVHRGNPAEHSPALAAPTPPGIRTETVASRKALESTSASPSRSPGTRPPEEFLEITGIVIEEGTGRALPGLDLVLRPHGVSPDEIRGTSPESPPAPARARTGAEGTFRLRLPAADWSLHEFYAFAITEDSGERVFLGTVYLETEMHIHVNPALTLRARIVTSSGRPVAGQSVGVFYVPEWRSDYPYMCGDTRTDAEGRVEVRIRPEHIPACFELRIAYEQRGSFLKVVDTRALLTPEGATVVLEVRELLLRIRDERREPVPNAEMRASPRPAKQARQVVVSKSGLDGTAGVVLEPGEWEYCVGKEGFVPVVDRVGIPAGDEIVERTVILAAARHTLRGEVVYANGTRAPKAFVHALPVTENREISVPGFVRSIADEEGRFSMGLTLDVTYRIGAWHGKSGFWVDGKAEERLVGPETEFLTLALEPMGTLVIKLRSAAPGLASRSGDVRFVLKERHTGRLLRDQESEDIPAVLTHVPEGEWTVTAILPGGGAWGRSSALVERGRVTELVVHLDAASILSGIVRAPAGDPVAGLRVECVEPGWERELAPYWGSARTDAGGAFRIVAGDLERARVRVFRGTEEIGGGFLHAGVENVIEVPPRR